MIMGKLDKLYCQETIIILNSNVCSLFGLVSLILAVRLVFVGFAVFMIYFSWRFIICHFIAILYGMLVVLFVRLGPKLAVFGAVQLFDLLVLCRCSITACFFSIRFVLTVYSNYYCPKPENLLITSNFWFIS